MIEPDNIAGARMGGGHPADLARAQAFSILPLKLDIVVAAVAFYHGALGRLKGHLPGKTKAVAEVANVHVVLLEESISDLLGNAREDFARVGNGCLAAPRRARLAEED